MFVLATLAFSTTFFLLFISRKNNQKTSLQNLSSTSETRTSDKLIRMKHVFCVLFLLVAILENSDISYFFFSSKDERQQVLTTNVFIDQVSKLWVIDLTAHNTRHSDLVWYFIGLRPLRSRVQSC